MDKSDSDPSDNVHETLDNLFPTNHKHYGYMDFFSWENMHDVYLGASGTPLKNMNVVAAYHLFWLAKTSDYWYANNGAPRRTGGSPARTSRRWGGR